MVHLLIYAPTMPIRNQKILSLNYEQIQYSSSTNDLHHPQQNPAERRIQVYKKGTNTVLYRTGASGYVRLYALMIWVGISNCMAEPSHGKLSAREISFGTTPDIIEFMRYTFYTSNYYYNVEHNFNRTKEQHGLCIGPTHTFGDSLLYIIHMGENCPELIHIMPSG